MPQFPSAAQYRESLSSSRTCQEAGIDARLGEIAGAIQETMESYEVEINGKLIPGKIFGIFMTSRY